MRRAVVIGAGIVGLTTSLALRRAGIEVVVHERAPEIRAAGTGLGLWANAMAVFDELGIGDEVRAFGKPGEMYFHDAAGRLLETPEYGVDDHRFLLVHRAKLNDLLADAVGRENIHLSSAFERFDERDGQVAVRSATGREDIADVLVGADGAFSAVREQVVPGTAARRHPGHHVWRAIVPDPGGSLTEDRLILGSERCRGGYVRTHDGSVYWLVNQFDTPPLTGTLKDQARHRAARLGADGGNRVLDELIAATPEEAILHNEIMIVPPLPRWVSARVALAGDAAHAMSPHITAGATLGIEDAALLGRLLTPPADVPAALKTYEADRIPRYAHVADLSAAVEHAPSPQDFATRYAAFHHWMLAPSLTAAG